MSKHILPLKESTKHGSLSFPCACYHALSTAFPVETPFICHHHWHEELEILFLEEGCFSLEVGMEHYQIDQKCFCFVNGAEMHALSSPQNYSEYAVVFLPTMLKFSDTDESQERLILPLIHNEISFPRFIRQDHPLFHKLEALYKDITEICQPDPLYKQGEPVNINLTPAQQLHIKANLLAMLSLIAEADLFTTELPTQDRKIDVLKSSISFMKDHYSEKIYISDLASLANMNEQYYCRFFKKAMGRSPMEYLNDMRIQRSLRLLRESQKSVLEISLECGFYNLGNYMRTFKRATGCTPLQYRKSFE